MDGLLGALTKSPAAILFGSSTMKFVNRLNAAARRERRKVDAEASRAATRVIPVDDNGVEALVHVRIARDTRPPPTVLLADTLARHAPPVRALIPSIREARAA